MNWIIFNGFFWLMLLGLIIFLISFLFYKLTKKDFTRNWSMLGAGMFIVFILLWGVYLTGLFYPYG
jgi:hypothetical protein